MKKAQWLVVAASVVLGLVACSSEDGPAAPATGTSSSSSSSSGDDGTPAKTTVHVSAAAGGTVGDPTGKVSLAIPAGALTADTDITVQVSPAANGAAGDVVEFGPDGLQFSKPVALTLNGAGITVPDGKSGAIGLFDGTSFKPIEGSTFANGTGTANIAHFSKYAIVIVDGVVKLVPPASCTETSATYQPCGGDPKGVFTIADFCIDPKVLGADPFQGKCPDFVGGVSLVSDRTVTIDATTVSTSAGTETTSFEYSFSLTCAQGKTSCAQISDTKSTCTDAGGGKCSCKMTESKTKEASTGTYSVSGTTFTTDDSQGSYCRKANLLSYRDEKDGKPTGVIYVLQQK